MKPQRTEGKLFGMTMAIRAAWPEPCLYDIVCSELHEQ